MGKKKIKAKIIRNNNYYKNGSNLNNDLSEKAEEKENNIDLKTSENSTEIINDDIVFNSINNDNDFSGKNKNTKSYDLEYETKNSIDNTYNNVIDENQNEDIENINNIEIDKIKNNNTETNIIEDNSNLKYREENINSNNKIDEKINLSEDIINEKVKSALEYTNSKKRKKSIILSVCLLILNLIFLTFIVKNLIAEIDGDIFSIFKTQGHKLWWLLGGVVAYLVAIIVQIFTYKVLIKSLAGKGNSKIAYDTAVVGRYYDNVTPFAVGGQPMQIVALIKNNISPAAATGVPLIKMVINTGMSAVSALIFFVFGLPLMQVNSPLNQILVLILEVLGVIGLVITLFITIFMFLISSGTLITRSFISGVLRIGYKLKIVKNYRQTYRKVLNQVAEYKFSIKYLLKNKKVLFKLILFNFIESVAYSFMPYFVTMALLNTTIESSFLFMFICLTKYYLCTMASCFIPLPGGTGLMEISFIVLFGMVLGDNIVWALILWRILSYYLIIAHGFIHELIKIIKDISKNKKNKNLETIETQNITDVSNT